MRTDRPPTRWRWAFIKFLNSSKVFSNIKMATGVLMSIPPIIVFLIMQKQLINGVVTTGVKG